MRPRLALTLLFALIIASRLCHTGILWAEETLPLAAAVQMLHGKTLYLEGWFDKPPLVPAIYLLWGAHTGLLLRLAGAGYIFAACLLVYRFASELWGLREGILAAWLLGFFLIFGIPAAVMPLAADLLLLVPHVAAVYLAWRGTLFWAGAAAGVGFLFNSKALFVAAACIVFAPRAAPHFAVGFVLPNAIAVTWMAATGVLLPYWQQVWEWGILYSRNTFLERPVWNGIVRTGNWLGFHAALAIGAASYFLRSVEARRSRFAVWLVLSAMAVAAGWRFFPRYYFQLLPVIAVLAARGWFLLPRWRNWALAILLVTPLVRFGPRYIDLARDLIAGTRHQWVDLAMDQDSREAASIVESLALPHDTLFVWGYRPEIYAYTRRRAGSRFLESQPLTGVFADRHLVQSEPLARKLTQRHRAELARSAPDFVLDGLGAYNPNLAITAYPDLAPWLDQYREVARTKGTVVYRLR